jgi:hypothetical protein
MSEKGVVIYNKGSRRFKLTNDPEKGKHVWLEPGTSLEVDGAKAVKLLKFYGRELVDLSKMAKPSKGSAELEKTIKDRDARIAELTVKIDGLEKRIASILNDKGKTEKQK